MDRIFRTIVYRPGWILAGVAVFTLFMAAQMYDVRAGEPRLRIETAVNRILPDQDEGRRLYDEFRDRFGNDELLLVAMVDDDIFTSENLHRIKRMTRRLSRADGIRRVVSLSNSPDIRSDGDEVLLESIYDEVPEDEAALRALRRRVLENPLHVGNLVSLDGRAVSFLVYPDDMSEKEFRDRGIDQEVERIAVEEAGDATAVVVGAPGVKAATSRLLLRDLLTFWPLSLTIMAAVGFATFRSIRGIVVPLASLGLAQVWTLGALAASGRSLNLITYIVPPLILAVGFAYAAHMLSAFAERLRERTDEDARESVFLALRHVAFPIFLTALTTAAGFASLTTSAIPAIRDFGIFCVVGVVSAFLASLTFAPALLSLMPAPRGTAGPSEGGRLDRYGASLGTFAARHSGAILLAGVAVAGLAVLGLTQIRVNTSLTDNLHPDDPVRLAQNLYNEYMDGSAQFYIVLDAGEPGAFKEPENVDLVREIQTWADEQPEVGGTTSLADYIRVVNRAFNEGDPDQLVIPRSKMLIGQYLFFFWNDQLENFVDSDFAATSILLRVPSYDTQEYAALLDRIEERLDTLPEGISAYVTGNTALVVRTLDDITLGQTTSLSLALVIIFVILAVYFRSLRLGFLALLPNALPVVVYFGVLGLSGVTLNIITALIACIILGIAVDDTIHYLVRYKEKASSSGDSAQAASDALRSVMRPVTSTTVALSLGFLVLTTSGLRHQVEFGWLAALMLSFAWLVDVTFTPALASRTMHLGRSQ